MKKFKEKGFTLIELIAVLVIMAIIALIVTPLVINIIRKARVSADKRSIDAYGRSIELAIAGYLLDNGKFPTEVSQLTIEYSGNKVECETTQINTDSSVYLAGCTVAGRSVEGYTYGKEETVSYKAYSIGDQVTYNNVDYYVLKDSGAKESTVTLLKATPLTVDEVNQYGGVGTENNHVNMYNCLENDTSCYRTAYNHNGYGDMAYYTSENCGFNGSDWVYDGCKNDYKSSEIKYVVDAWAIANVTAGLQEARLISEDDIYNNFEFEEYDACHGCGSTVKKITTTWLYRNDYQYWTNSLIPNSSSVKYVSSGGWLSSDNVYLTTRNFGSVRPVIVLDKSVL